MKKLSLLFISVLLASCGGDYGNGVQTLRNASIGDVVEIKPALDSTDLSFVRTICSTLRTKRLDLQSAQDINSVTFDIATGTCNETQTLAETIVFINSSYNGQINFVPSVPGSFLLESRAQTDIDGTLREFCNASLNNMDVNMVYTNYLNQGIAYNFSGTNEFQRTIIVKDQSSEDRLAEKYSYMIETNTSETRNAIVEKVTYESQCSNTKVKTDSQVLKTYNL